MSTYTAFCQAGSPPAAPAPTPAPLTALALATACQQADPQGQYAYTTDGLTVGQWDAAQGRYVARYGLTLKGTWAAMPELRVNGKRIEREWVAVTREVSTP